MPFPSNTSEQIFSRIRDRLVADGRFNSLSSTSTVRMLMEIFSGELGISHSLMIDAMQQTQLSHAVGRNLDELGKLVGIVRRTATRAVDDTRANVKFFIDPALGLTIKGLISRRIPAATISAYTTLTEGSITITAGMIITDRNSRKRYITTQDVTLSDKEIFVPVIAEGIGSAYNVGFGELSRWKWELQPEFETIKDFILVTNTASISSGSTVESDNSLRARIFNSVPENATGNEISIQQAALSVPGVRTAAVIGGFKGPGTYKVNITGTSPIVSHGLMDSVKQASLSVAALGSRAYVERPRYLGTEIRVIVLFTETALEHDAVLRNIRENIVSYVNSIPASRTLVINELRERIQGTSEDILDHIIASIGIGTFNPDTAVNENKRMVSIVNQRSKIDEQFYTNAAFIKVCE